MITYSLDNAEEIAAEFPSTFYIPSRPEREAVTEGQIVKLIFRFETEDDAFVERMWVIVKKRKGDGSFAGVLDNDPTGTDEIRSGMEVTFGSEHIIAIWGPEDPHQKSTSSSPEHVPLGATKIDSPETRSSEPQSGDNEIKLPQEMLHEVGAFEPREAKRVLAAFEARQIPFEVESDHSALARPGRWIQQYFGVYPEGSKLVIFVPESSLPEAHALLTELFPGLK